MQALTKHLSALPAAILNRADHDTHLLTLNQDVVVIMWCATVCVTRQISVTYI
jgi:hypothetical protein